MNARKLSKRIIAVVLTAMMVVSCFVVSLAVNAANEDNKIVFHYLRKPDADGKYGYEDWALWLWPRDGEGKEYSFDTNSDGSVFYDENGARVTFPVTDVTKDIGVIVKSAGSWSKKDPDGAKDRFVVLKGYHSGTVDVFLVTDDIEYSYDMGQADSDLLVVKAASNTGLNEISFDMTRAPRDGESAAASDFELKDESSGTVLSFSGFEISNNKGVIKPDKELEIGTVYTITYAGDSVQVTLPDVFSTPEFEEKFTYTGDDLGATYSKEKTAFRVWAPTATGIDLNLYDAGNDGNKTATYAMTADEKGTWVYTVEGDLNGTYYTYSAHFGSVVTEDITDPYARTTGVNGKRGMVIDLDSTDPEGWDSDARHTYANPTDMTIYELHIRDFSTDPDCGIKNTGKYIAFTEQGTKTSDGTPTGIDHLKDLGITSVHILPSYDFGSVDETKLDTAQFNWGYDPVNYNTPEGSYSTDPYHGEVRVKEYKQMVQALHNAGIGVIMDVVYNHTYNKTYCFNQLVPDYFYRPNDSNGSGCGNDVASERSMVSKFISDSVKYWADEYHLDGFRFDLMGLIDVDTMNNCRKAVDTIDKNIFLYGEGWEMGTELSKADVKLANQKNAAETPGIAYFSDKIRDGIRGNVFEATEAGYVGDPGAASAATIKNSVNYSSDWSPSPVQTINYDSCHDNHTIWDRLATTNPGASEEQRIKMNKLSAAIVFTSQGVPFMMSGEEFLRSKPLIEKGSQVYIKAGKTDRKYIGSSQKPYKNTFDFDIPVFDHNSYKSSDETNLLDYSRVKDYSDVYEYYKGLIAMRNAYPQFRMTTAEDVKNNTSWLIKGTLKEKMGFALGYKLSGDKDILVYYNPSEDLEVELPEGKWGVIANAEKAGTEVLSVVEGKTTVSATSALVLVAVTDEQKSDDGKTDGKTDDGKTDGKTDDGKTDGKTDDGKTDDGKKDNEGSGKVDVDNGNGNANVDNGNGNANVDNSGSNTGSPNTGDSTMAVVFVAAAAIAAFVGITVYKKRRSVQ